MKNGYHVNSFEAWLRIEEFISEHQKIIYRAIRKKKSATRYDIASVCSLSPEQISKRLKEMQIAGLIKFDKDKNVNGRTCSAYRIREYLESRDVVTEKISKTDKEILRLTDEVERLKKENEALCMTVESLNKRLGNALQLTLKL